MRYINIYLLFIITVVNLQVCPGVFSSPLPPTSDEASQRGSERKRRSATSSSIISSSSSSSSSTPAGPRMLTMAVLQTAIPNLPPVVQTTSHSVPEDTDANFTIVYTDPEGDAVAFRLVGQPGHGSAQVSLDGQVHYRPDPDYSGPDDIHVVGKFTQSDSFYFIFYFIFIFIEGLYGHRVTDRNYNVMCDE